MFRSMKIFNLTLRSHFVKVTSVRNYAPRRKRTSEPGINKRMPFLKDDFLENDDPEVIDSMEPNFMNLDQTYRQHEMEIKRSKEKIQRIMIGKKYFHVKSPNFLTYNEKEQIRALHNEDPDKWTPDKLSESFPADPYAIGLVIRSKWIPKDTNRIYKHDESVRTNWQQFNDGKLEVEPILAKHLKKFAFRGFNKLSDRPTNKRLGVEFPKPKSNEFLSIVKSCTKYTEKHEAEIKQIESSDIKIPNGKLHDENLFMMLGKKKFPARQVTLAELQQKDSEIDFKVKLNELNKSSNAPIFKQSLKENNFISLNHNDENVKELLEIEEKIIIPKNLWEKGKIYKVNDCFYADDGEFLYRVPGF